MASTSTNKQPLLVDSVIWESLNLTDVITGNPNNSDVTGTNNAEILVSCVNSDGAIIEEIRTISRGTTRYTVNLYMSTEADYLRPGVAQFVGRIRVVGVDAQGVPEDPETDPVEGTINKFTSMMNTLVPVPHIGTDPTLKALYVPKGKALWVALQSQTQGMADAPYVQAQGGRY